METTTHGWQELLQCWNSGSTAFFDTAAPVVAWLEYCTYAAARQGFDPASFLDKEIEASYLAQGAHPWVAALLGTEAYSNQEELLRVAGGMYVANIHAIMRNHSA
jgi:hypothetical protein